ncbi:MAG TPA: D-aminoacyl-tRNA deacylase, partial [Gammaproteobacteria bacterium]|nr:D-aminoacyl-tRNA deacylase [Gammaproteobacteria bacterium]
MIALLQRVIHARVEIGGISVASIDRGLLVLVAVERGDDSAQVDRMLERIFTYRVFADAQGRMNLNLTD